MNPCFQRLSSIIGEEKINKLSSCRIIVFGVGGVGGAATVALARSGVGYIDIVDADVVEESNINRQYVAATSTIGQSKVAVMEKILKDINPAVEVTIYNIFYLPDNEGGIDLSKYDYVIDCIDTLKAKCHLIKRCKELDVPIISALGCGNRFDPRKLEITDIYKTKGDPFAKTVRKSLRDLGIKHLDVVYSTEEPSKPLVAVGDNSKGRHSPGSSFFVPNAAGISLAYAVIDKILGGIKPNTIG